MNQLMPVPFYGDQLFIVEHNGEPYIPMKPVVEGMGLDWASQFVKLKREGDGDITIPQSNRWQLVKLPVMTKGNMQEMICIPFRKLTGWLYTVNPNKVHPNIKDKIIRYQEECDEVLWQHWTQQAKPQQAYQFSELEIAALLQGRSIYEVAQMTGLPLNEVLAIVQRHPAPLNKAAKAPVPAHLLKTLEAFWAGLQQLMQQQDINHSRDPNILAFNLPQVYRLAALAGITLPLRIEVLRALPYSQQPQFLYANRGVASRLMGKTVKCWGVSL